MTVTVRTRDHEMSNEPGPQLKAFYEYYLTKQSVGGKTQGRLRRRRHTVKTEKLHVIQWPRNTPGHKTCIDRDPACVRGRTPVS